jgi:hypothetical protein
VCVRVSRDIVGVRNAVTRLTRQLLVAIAEHRTESVVDTRITAFQIDDRHPDRGTLKRAAEELLCLVRGGSRRSLNANPVYIHVHAFVLLAHVVASRSTL